MEYVEEVIVSVVCFLHEYTSNLIYKMTTWVEWKCSC